MGWDSPSILMGALTGLSSIAMYIWWELRSAAPMLDLRLFHRKLVALEIAAGRITFLGTSAARFMMPFYCKGFWNTVLGT